MAKRKRRRKADVRVFFHDEVPQIGSGWRGVTIKQVGYKWAHLTETGTETNFRLPISKWNEMVAGSNRRMK